MSRVNYFRTCTNEKVLHKKQHKVLIVVLSLYTLCKYGFKQIVDDKVLKNILYSVK